MRIITNVPDLSLSAGTERAQLAVCRELAKRGHRIDLLFQREGWLLEQWREFASTALELTCRPASFIAAQRMSGFVRSSAEDVVVYIHHSGHWSNLGVAIVASWWWRAPLVVHMHVPYGGHYSLPRIAVRMASRSPAGMIFVSHALRQAWFSAGAQPPRDAVIANGIDVDYYSSCTETQRRAARGRLGIDERNFVFLMLGRLVKEKGVHVLLAAWMQVLARQRSKSPQLLCVGEVGDCAIAEAIKNAGATLLPWVRDVRDVYCASDVVVVPSVWNEPFPLTVLEALSGERPVIAADAGGIREALGAWGSRHTWCVVPRGDANALAQAMVLMLATDDSQRRRMGAEGREFVATSRSLKASADAVEEFLPMVINSHRDG